ncbi:MAG: hypothetical protein OXQ84_15495 [bacterium]|nr:hypothetical protein [bacterium]
MPESPDGESAGSLSPALDMICHTRFKVHVRTRDWLDNIIQCDDPDEQAIFGFVAELLAEGPAILPVGYKGNPHELVTGWVREKIDERKRKG